MKTITIITTRLRTGNNPYPGKIIRQEILNEDGMVLREKRETCRRETEFECHMAIVKRQIMDAETEAIVDRECKNGENKI